MTTPPQTPEARRLQAAHAAIAARIGAAPEVALILGSGLGDLAGRIEGATLIPYAEVPGMPAATAPGHEGRFVLGMLHGRRVVAMQGRLHLYEGHRPGDVVFPVRLMARMGAGRLIVTNAAGGLNPDYRPGTVMLIEDHLNLTGTNPLVGPNEDSLGLRFPDMSRAYCPDLCDLALAAGAEAGVALHRGVYAGVLGPVLETSAERRFARMAGGDAVGMSTVMEVIAAVHAGQRVLGLSAITNAATGGPEQEPDTIEAVLANASVAGREIAALLEVLLPRV